jgi:hypothetical protein
MSGEVWSDLVLSPHTTAISALRARNTAEENLFMNEIRIMATEHSINGDANPLGHTSFVDRKNRISYNFPGSRLAAGAG